MSEFQNFVVVKDTIPGEDHLKQGLPCQDTVGHLESHELIILAQSDGVSKCKGSHLGSSAMVNFGLLAAQQYIRNMSSYISLDVESKSKRNAMSLLSYIRDSMLIRLGAWSRNYCSPPFGVRPDNAIYESVKEYLQATFNFAIITPKFTLIAGIGDGNWMVNGTWTEITSTSKDPEGANRPATLAVALLPEKMVVDSKGQPMQVDTLFTLHYLGKTTEVSEVGLASDGMQYFDKKSKMTLSRNNDEPHGTLDQFWTPECLEDPFLIRHKINLITIRNGIWHGDDVSFVVAKRKV